MQTEAEQVAHYREVIEALLKVIEAQAHVMLAVANTLNGIHR